VRIVNILAAEIPLEKGVFLAVGVSGLFRQGLRREQKPLFPPENHPADSSGAEGTGPFFGRRFSRKTGLLAEKWTSPQPARKRLRFGFGRSIPFNFSPSVGRKEYRAACFSSPPRVGLLG